MNSPLRRLTGFDVLFIQSLTGNRHEDQDAEHRRRKRHDAPPPRPAAGATTPHTVRVYAPGKRHQGWRSVRQESKKEAARRRGSAQVSRLRLCCLDARAQGISLVLCASMISQPPANVLGETHTHTHAGTHSTDTHAQRERERERAYTHKHRRTNTCLCTLTHPHTHTCTRIRTRSNTNTRLTLTIYDIPSYYLS